jgi:hypothetical protein
MSQHMQLAQRFGSLRGMVSHHARIKNSNKKVDSYRTLSHLFCPSRL